MSNFDLEDEFIARTQKNLIAIECFKGKKAVRFMRLLS